MIHIILYSNGEPFTSTKNKTIESLNQINHLNIKIHDYSLKSIKDKDWFKNIENLPKVKNGSKSGRRDGYYNAWKPYITKEVYDIANENDIIYYVDSSRYFLTGFTENIDNLINCVNEIGFIAGSCGTDVNNKFKNVCSDIRVWKAIIKDKDDETINKCLDKMHILNSWFILKKGDLYDSFINDWCYYTTYHDPGLNKPLVTHHNAVDQSIFTILVYKYGYKVFHKPGIMHGKNKNKNIVLKILNKHVKSHSLKYCIENFFITL